MIYRIFDGGEEINRIVADEAFIAVYTAQTGYTTELCMEPEEPPDAADALATEVSDTELLLELAAAHEERICLLELGVN